ncbi:MAG: hypothetical protein ACREJC_19255, partial [Tepidisphaeraceae bacterium]
MESILDQLSGDDEALLMYLSGELSEPDRTRVQQRLSADPLLRAKLDALQRTCDSTNAAMAALDGSDQAAAQAALVRRAGRAMKQWQLQRLARVQTQPDSPRTFRVRWWVYPLAAAAAMVAIVVMVWRGRDSAPVTVAAKDVTVMRAAPSGAIVESTDPE